MAINNRRNVVKKVGHIPTKRGDLEAGDKVFAVYTEGDDVPAIYKDGVGWNDVLGASRFELGIVLNCIHAKQGSSYTYVVEMLAVDTENK